MGGHHGTDILVSQSVHASADFHRFLSPFPQHHLVYKRAELHEVPETTTAACIHEDGQHTPRLTIGG